MSQGGTQMLEEGVLCSPDPALSQEESTGVEGMAVTVLTAEPQGSMSFSSVTVAFTQEDWRYPVPAPRDRYKERILGKSRNLVLLGLSVSQPGLNSQLEQRKEPWLLEEGLRSTCPDWTIISKESPPKQNVSEESFRDPSVEIPPGESDHKNSEFGKSFNLRLVLSPQQSSYRRKTP